MMGFPLAPDLLLAAQINNLWYALPLIVAVSVVYSATRHELPRPIAVGAIRMGGWIVAFMLVGFLLLSLMLAMI
jgi:hypothetical protein